MKRFMQHIIIASMAIMMIVLDASAQVDMQRSFGVVCKDNNDYMLPEGGNWKITFSTTDSLGNNYRKPVTMVFNGSLLNDSTNITIETIDSLMFDVPELRYEAGVYEIEEEQFRYIVESDTFKTVYFRIDCITKIQLPKVGQKVICNIYRGKLPYGFMGEVASMKADYGKGWIEMKCNPVALEDVYSVFYGCGVSHANGSDEVPDSIIEMRKVRKRALTRTITRDAIITDTIVKNIYTFEKKIAITDEGEIKEDEDEGAIVIAAEGTAVLGTYCSVIINNEAGIKKVKCTVDMTVGGLLTVDANASLEPDEDEKTSHDFLNIPIPVVILPGLSVNVDIGVTWNYKLEASLHAESWFNISRTAGISIDGSNRDVIWTTEKEDNSKKPFKLENGNSAEITLQGELFLALHCKVGIGLGGEGLVFQLKFGTGPKFSASLHYKTGQKASTLNDDPDWLNERIEIYKSLNDGTFFKIEWGFLFDLEFSVAKDQWSFAVSEWLEKLGIDNVLYVDMYSLLATPSTDEIKKRMHYNDYCYRGILPNTNNLIFFYDAGMMFIDASPGATVDGHPDYVVEGIGKFEAIKPNEVSFDLNLEDKAHIKGRRLHAYPILYNPFFTEYAVIGIVDTLYMNYKVKMKDSKKDYDICTLKAEFDADALQNPNITEGGFIIYDPENGEEAGREILFSGILPSENKLETVMRRGKYVFEEYNVKAYLYDSVNDEYSYSPTWPCGFLSYYTPETLAPTEITAVGATLNGAVHQAVVDAENFDHITNKFSVGFTYYPNGSTAMDYLNNVRGASYNWDLSGKLTPDTEYRFRTVLRDNETNKQYNGAELVFKTKPVFYNFNPYVNNDNVLLAVMADKGFVDTSNKSKYYFVISEERDKWEDDKDVRVVYDEEMNDELDNKDDSRVLVRIVKVGNNDFGRDDDEQDYDIGIMSEKGWEPGRTYYAKAVYDDGKGRRYETDIVSFKTPAPIDNLKETPDAEFATLFADVLSTYADGAAKIILRYTEPDNKAKSEGDDDYSRIWDFEELEIQEQSAWNDKHNGFENMSYVLDGLEPSTEYIYYYKVVKEVDGVSTTYTSTLENFKTKKLEYKATTETPLINKNKAILKGNINELLCDLLNKSITEESDRDFIIYFDVARDRDMTDAIRIYEKFDGGRTFETQLTNLAWSCDFYCRFSVQPKGNNRVYRGAVKKFSIGAEPVDNFEVETFDVAIEDEWTICKSKVNNTVLDIINSDKYDDIRLGFEFAPTEADIVNGTEAVDRISDGTLNKSTGLFSSVLKLKPNSTYYARSFLYCGGKLVNGGIRSFKTAEYDAGLIIPDMEAARRALETKAVSRGNATDELVIFDKNGVSSRNKKRTTDK